MKATIVKLLPIALLFSSCGTGVFLTSGNSDDVYYNPADKQVVINKRVDVAQAPAKQENAVIAHDSIRVAEQNYALIDSTNTVYLDENGNRIGDENNYYDSDDDYYYSNRINRFCHPSIGFGYYDPWYSGFGMSFGMGYGGFGYYDPFFYDFYSPFGYNSWYNPWYSPWYSPWYGGYYGYGYGWNDWGWDYYNPGKNENYQYGPRRSSRTDGVSGSSRTGDLQNSNRVYARGGATSSGSSVSNSTKSGSLIGTAAPRSSSDSKAVSRPSGYRTISTAGQDNQIRTNSQLQQNTRTNSSSYIRSRNSSSYVQSGTKGSSPLRSANTNNAAESGARSSYVRPKTSGSSGISSGSYRSSQPYRSSQSSGTVRSSSSSSNNSSYTAPRSSYNSSSSSGRSSSGSFSSSSSSSGRSSMSSGSSGGGGGGGSRGGGGGGGGRR